MLSRNAIADKILVLGIDGLDPRLTRKYVDTGLMPNTKTFIERGAQRHDLSMLGGHPTITPPMWTTLSTGANSNVHGIDDFYIRGNEIDENRYALDSRSCKAEQAWNCFAEAGKRTLVWHWPGCAWPPTSDSENLLVVDGSAPGVVCSAVNMVEDEFLIRASEEIQEITFKTAGMEAHAACVIDGVELEETEERIAKTGETGDSKFIIFKQSQRSVTVSGYEPEYAVSSIKPATGWTNAPEDAKEFVVLLSNGLLRRPALILKNADGKYDSVAIYKSKKEEKPIVVLPVNVMVYDIIDEAISNDIKYQVNRNMRLLELDPEGKSLELYISQAMDINNDSAWHPKRLFREIQEKIGYLKPNSMLGNQDKKLISDCMLANWDAAVDFQADALLYLIEKENLDCIFSHMHNVDLQMHCFVKYMGNHQKRKHELEYYTKFAEDVYKQADRYIGRFLPLLDKDWTVLIVSDHGLVASTYESPFLQDGNGICTPLMEEMGFTVLKQDENGKKIGEIDWTKTRAVMARSGHVYLNIKGRDTHTLSDGSVLDGIVDPADQYELEEEIMTKLYQLTDKTSGHRIVSVALRNRDAVLLGLGGERSGDVLCWMAEGYNQDHGDNLATAYGDSDTSVAPLFIAAGKGLKSGYETDRYIREVDVAATVVALGGVRFPAQCEGAPIYQIFEENF